MSITVFVCSGKQHEKEPGEGCVRLRLIALKLAGLVDLEHAGQAAGHADIKKVPVTLKVTGTCQ